MKNVIRTLSTVGLVLGLVGSTAHAAPVAPAAAAKGAFQRDLLGVYSDAEKKVLDLEEAVPQNKFDWRPAPGVRSIAEAYLHIAFGNYAMIKFVTGKEPPAEAGFEMNPVKWDKKSKDKAEIKKILEASFAFVHAGLAALPDADLDKMVNFFGHEMTTRAVLIILDGHINEHLGQSVAYARANKITPPWSKDEKANEKAHMAEKKP
ncbi:MAG TPA: DinB family protein [Polyangia bacterium]